ncbi:hypothetical protein [Roseateles sp. LYH14W]|uniref:Uncharacterized protein n=1 Tax=Pelomonas parva TaxID=3299032 RepID=A0ABW7F024_9BURK
MRKALCVAAMAVTMGAAAQPAAPLLPPQAEVAGESQEEWTKHWWRWAKSFDDGVSPVADRDGRHCGLGQSGPVWFLAGTYGTQRAVRHCRVPAGKTLFFPLINYVTYTAEGQRLSCASLMQSAARLTDTLHALVLEVNGQRFEGLAEHRQATRRCFLLFDDDDTLAAGNGYYAAIGPLAPGRHTLNYGGMLPGMSQAVTYTLDVE